MYGDIVGVDLVDLDFVPVLDRLQGPFVLPCVFLEDVLYCRMVFCPEMGRGSYEIVVKTLPLEEGGILILESIRPFWARS